MNNLAVQLQRTERLCVRALMECDEALDREDWPAFINWLSEYQRQIARLFEAENMLVYPKLLLTDIASMRECTELRDEQDRIDALAEQTSRAAFMRDKARCRSRVATLRDRVMTHWMLAQRQIAALARRSDSLLKTKPAHGFKPAAAPPNQRSSRAALNTLKLAASIRSTRLR